jgi:hypothetical protein
MVTPEDDVEKLTVKINKETKLRHLAKEVIRTDFLAITKLLHERSEDEDKVVVAAVT